MIIVVANQKGGVGKTTTAINLAAALAQRGSKTLLVDLDPQGNATLSFISPDTFERSIYDVLVDPDVDAGAAVQPTPLDELDLLPATIAVAKAEAKLIGEFDSHFRLKDKLAPIKDLYDYIVIDTPPTLGILTVNALVAATHLIVPIQSSYYALEGTDDLLDTYEKIRARPNPDLQFLGVVITIHDRRTNLARDVRARIQSVFGEKVFSTTISKSVRLEESPAYKQSIFTFAPNSTGATEYYSLSEEVIGRA
ncbi:MAG: AAA family ATPase [Acidobacteria bacterium]|nr:AAA family ATPase [Acidobacteriota bacterium]NIM62876.1 AAA family ATPase [Acidobacteriota bacterium]NIO58819.1 AAA family ATPase [Acidobacteriota bacterium]NIQ29876.1 AAA family ATPase [Acidobacteriota bacterium]NIQ84600.1 AAA family ATPase [Acidobacteriota bacterium]